MSQRRPKTPIHHEVGIPEIKQAASALPPDKQMYFLGYVTAIADMTSPQPQTQPAAQDVKS